MSTPSEPAPRLPSAVRSLLQLYRETHAPDVRLWKRSDGAWSLLDPLGVEPHAQPAADADTFCVAGWPPLHVEVGDGDREARFLSGAIERILRLHAEIRHLSGEIASRYEEITLLYSISETLGSVISLEEAAGKILDEVISTLGARRAALWVHDPQRDELYLLAAVGLEGQSRPIPLSDRASVTAEVFRERRAMIMDPEDIFPRGDEDTGATRRGYFLSVPVSYTPPQGETRMVGVINLVGRTSEEPYSAGDLHLVSAIASQVGAAVENGRLIAETLRQERLVREMELAHDLQLKLLPSTKQFAGYADVAARFVPAESVGGDFYHVLRLSGGRLGVMIGDVSSHGFSAALIMALTMSAVAIHASEGDSPVEVLRRIHRALIDELQTTEMFLTLFYGVIDPRAGRIDYANAGHHHAFRIRAGGAPERLGVTNPPFGMVNLESYAESSTSWTAGEDLLFLFTDGLSDALPGSLRAAERALLEIVDRNRSAPLEETLDRLFDMTEHRGGVAADDRTAVLVRI